MKKDLSIVGVIVLIMVIIVYLYIDSRINIINNKYSTENIDTSLFKVYKVDSTFLKIVADNEKIRKTPILVAYTDSVDSILQKMYMIYDKRFEVLKIEYKNKLDLLDMHLKMNVDSIKQLIDIEHQLIDNDLKLYDFEKNLKKQEIRNNYDFDIEQYYYDFRQERLIIETKNKKEKYSLEYKYYIERKKIKNSANLGYKKLYNQIENK